VGVAAPEGRSLPGEGAHQAEQQHTQPQGLLPHWVLAGLDKHNVTCSRLVGGWLVQLC